MRIRPAHRRWSLPVGRSYQSIFPTRLWMETWLPVRPGLRILRGLPSFSRYWKPTFQPESSLIASHESGASTPLAGVLQANWSRRLVVVSPTRPNLVAGEGTWDGTLDSSCCFLRV